MKKKNKIKKFNEFSNFNEKRKEIKKSIIEISNDREEKRNSVKKCTAEIRKLKRKLNYLTK